MKERGGAAMQVRAAVLHRSGEPRPYAMSRPLEITEVTLDPPGFGEVLIAIRAAGLCHSDLSVIEGVRPRPLPMVLGHEAAGVVAALGAGVTDLGLGDHVVTAFVPSCGACEPCLKSRPALCEPGAASNTQGLLLGGARRLSAAGLPLNHHLGVSAFATHAVVSRHSLIKVDRDLPFDQAALFGCAVMTGVGAVVNTAEVFPGARVAVIGLGGVGLAALLGARARGVEAPVAVDLADAKLALARELGAGLCVNAAAVDCVERIRDATHGGVDFAFEMAGSAKAMELAYRITRRGGTTVSAGLPPPQAQFSVPHVGLVAEERTVKGSYLGSCVPQRDIPRFIEWFRSGRLPVDRLVSAHIGFERINEAFDALADAAAVRQVILM
jgi:alcohol dehydrogenase